MSSSSSSSSSSPISSSSSPCEERTDEVSRRSRSEPAEKGKLSASSVYSCGFELKKRDKEAPKRAKSEEERSSMAYFSVSEFNDSSNDAEEGQINQPPLVAQMAVALPLLSMTWGIQRETPIEGLPTPQGIKGHLVSPLSNAIKLFTPFKHHRFILKVQRYLLTHKVQVLMAPSILALQFGNSACSSSTFSSL